MNDSLYKCKTYLTSFYKWQFVLSEIKVWHTLLTKVQNCYLDLFNVCGIWNSDILLLRVIVVYGHIQQFSDISWLPEISIIFRPLFYRYCSIHLWNELCHYISYHTVLKISLFQIPHTLNRSWFESSFFILELLHHK
jgi:hypothetical protein